jgi:chromosome segregation protein
VYLKSLTVKGFKSFATPTTLQFEPGVTCVVGPNGSGKSNVVDALTWVMGEQGAKSLRGGKMEDVIFAGTSGKSPLGRAEVSLTIDNSDGALPIDFTEVTISRIMFRSGGSDYSINGSPCRLLDVQELLSDSGIGREMHVIVGQGQLDSILHATVEDRRGFIEEAAGVLKHRKRKEKALRKLASLGDKLARLADLTSELRRQLKPLGRQAEVARRAVVIQSDVRDSRLRLLADDLSVLTAELAREQADEAALKQHKSEIEAKFLADEAAEAALIAENEAASTALAAAQNLWFELSGLVERFRSVRSVAGERSRNLRGHATEKRSGADPADLDRQAVQLEGRSEDLSTAVREQTQNLTERSAERAAVESDLSAEEHRVEAVAKAASDGREKAARLNGLVAAATSRLEARQAEVERLQESLTSRNELIVVTEAEFRELETGVAELSSGEVDLDTTYEEFRSRHADSQRNLESLRKSRDQKSNARAAADARLEALTAGLASRSETPAFVPEMKGVGSAVAEVLHVEPGLEKALTAVLGDVAAALVADSMASARSVVERVRLEGGSTRLVLVGDELESSQPESSWDGSVGRALDSFVSVPAELRAAIQPLIADIVVVSDLDEAAQAVAEGARRAVTMSGDVVSRTWFSGGDSSGTTVLELAAQVEAVESEREELELDMSRLRFAIEEGEKALAESKVKLDEALSALHASDAEMTAVADRLGSLGSRLKAARAESDRVAESLGSAQQSLVRDQGSVESAMDKVKLAEVGQEGQPTRITDRRQELSGRAASLRSAEMETRLALRTGEERLRALQSRMKQLRDSAASERRAAERWEQQQKLRARQTEVAGAVVTAADYCLGESERLAALADAERSAGEKRRRERDQQLNVLRLQLKQTSAELERLTDSVHRDEMLRTEQRVRIQQIQDKAMEEFGVSADSLVAEYGPETLVPPSLRAPGDEEDGGPDAEPYPYVRREQERRLRSSERAMKLLGKVNPLALEEYSAMEERYQFLSEQVEDLKHSRHDLESIIAGVDQRVEQVFSEAFADTAREFEQVFSRLFPGGEGRLILTDPGNMLTTGIEVEARPPGKRIKRLSLLSGGERSLTAVAFLVALFKARPSPFYVLDEVEAALDDINLGRLLEVIEELRASSQLIVITHQKRTMEAADALYGVTMRGDGVSRVVSQRISNTGSDRGSGEASQGDRDRLPGGNPEQDGDRTGSTTPEPQPIGVLQ